ncbi:SGNH/GDSL hydrolase family protein [Duganella dendranthematis]|uniref:SGNH/GDSL hydrolase family protein n=1 Tax=Duganella dendranthematis TaxID=2728021 RepID=A0ABX6MAS7_9BURK|nr:SGNH/GDSL hydrolase family protein [Duganella dendranthematis]QJD91431.1 SGNH/GDSL hydrolase family protein [Duganella dendranthematis]
MKRYLAAATLAAIITTPQAAENWLATWQASPHAVWEASEFALPSGVPAVLERQTVRETARISIGGSRLRVVLSNRYGTQPLVVGEVRVGRAGETMRPLTFGGQVSLVIPPGAPALSDALEMPVAALEKLAVSVYLPEHTPLATFHWGAQQTGVIVDGNRTADATLAGAQPLHGRALLSGIWVAAPAEAETATAAASEAMATGAMATAAARPAAGVVAAFGDSITDGNGSTPDQDHRWPDYLAARLSPGGVAVVNAGISGARLLGDRMGVNAAARFELDVLSQPGVRTAIVLMGTNDIGWPQSIFAPHEAPMTLNRMIAAYRQLIAQARARQVRIIGATLPPFEGTAIDGYYTPAKDALRRQVNQWIRESAEFDAVADMDALLRDPQQPSRMQPRYDSGDHLHPGDAGYEAMAAEVARVLSRY